MDFILDSETLIFSGMMAALVASVLCLLSPRCASAFLWISTTAAFFAFFCVLLGVTPSHEGIEFAAPLTPSGS